MNVQVKKVYRNYYLNIISALFKKLGLPQLIDHLVPVDPQCQTRVSDAVQAIIYKSYGTTSDGKKRIAIARRVGQKVILKN
ncbi:hypothetical protein B9L21_01785 [Geobacillus uzenensis]|uniref:DUF4277 domain-containing protein n=1 Tax=Geobacillus uzenensis TaxID=129339 RepID=A0ABX4DJ96_9BACL|nr:hypothetical protein B9L21_01785 [Geobacillus uzenensis]